MAGWSRIRPVLDRTRSGGVWASIRTTGRPRRLAWAASIMGLALGAAGCGAGVGPGATPSDASHPSMASVESAPATSVPTTEDQVVALDAVPTEVPLVVDRLLRVLALDAGAGWQVTVEFADHRGYDRARGALLAAGYGIVSESRPGELSWTGDFSNERYIVHLQVSNDTGGGFLGDYVIRRLS